MKLFKHIVKITFLLFVLIAVGIYAYIPFFAKERIQSKISGSLGKEVQIESLSYHFPFGLKAINVSISDVLQAKRVYIDVDVGSLFGEQIDVVQLELVNPILIMEGAKGVEDEQQKVSIRENGDSKNAKRFIDINKILVTNGQIQHALRVGGNSKLVKFVNLKGEITGLTLPLKSQKTKFKLESLTVIDQSPFDNHNAVTNGWIDLYKKDLEGKVNLINQKGEDSLRVNLFSSNNNMKVDGKIRLSFISPNDKKSSAVDKFVVNALKGDVIEADFSFPAKLDDFKISELKIPFKGTVSASNEL